jgi:hypothetical protein
MTFRLKTAILTANLSIISDCQNVNPHTKNHSKTLRHITSYNFNYLLYDIKTKINPFSFFPIYAKMKAINPPSFYV